MADQQASKPYIERDWKMLKRHAACAILCALAIPPLVFLDHWKLALAVPIVVLGAFELYCRTQRSHAIYHLYGQFTTVREGSEWAAEKVRDYFADWEQRRPTSRWSQWWIQNITHGKKAMGGHGSRADRDKAGSVLVRTRNLREDHEAEILTSMCSVRIGAQEGAPSIVTGAFRQSGMAIPSITRQATEAMARGVAGWTMIGTGEGGLWKEHLAGGPGAQVEFQVGTGYFGCRNPDGTFSMEKLVALIGEHPEIAAIQVKLSQGAKQDGGKAPGWKVDEEVARRRGIAPWKDCFSPGVHSAFRGADGLARFVRELRRATNRVIGLKMAVGSFAEFDDLCKAWVAFPDGMPDYLQIDGGEGGTGAAYEEMMKCGGMPASVAIQVVDLLLRKHGLRDRVRVVGSAGGYTPEDLIRMYALGADIVATGRGFKYAVGCIAAGKCHIGSETHGKGECPTGVAANGSVIDPVERGEWVRAYVQAAFERTAHLLSLTGVASYRDIVGSRLRYVDIRDVPIWTLAQVQQVIDAERA